MNGDEFVCFRCRQTKIEDDDTVFHAPQPEELKTAADREQFGFMLVEICSGCITQAETEEAEQGVV